ncbi:MAG: CBS domain-containing protein [Kofleriaceae bacterium]|nr:CBS domain-containing protein [Myxococcales bacterium]MCB9559145.1 CBS domain-containing protein [Kofleriaceae bacterium]MCB9575055.1 CBS domain-containing protein [Kofleriaceae bacterium]
MVPFDSPVSDFMTRELEVVHAEATLAEVARRLDERRISGVPVVDAWNTPLGVISRSDLVHSGRLRAGNHRGGVALRLPELLAGDVMTKQPVCIAPHAPLVEAAKLMRQHHIHRLCVVDDAGRLIGIITTQDLTAVVRDARVDRPVSEIMTTPIVSVRAEQPIGVAIERLDKAQVTALVVVDGDLPVGVFTQIEALASRDLPRATPIDDLFEPAIICLPSDTRIHRAAAQVARLDVRRIVACRDREAIGIVSGLDFARVVAGEFDAAAPAA